MDLTLKDVHLPKDPMASDQEHSDHSSMASERIRNKEWLDKKPNATYDVAQNDVDLHGQMMFVPQAVDSKVHDLGRPKPDAYSPTGNSWNQSDIDSEFHRYDPNRYPARIVR